ncbi:MAG: hypothetical protein LBN26_05230 [Christensenellaceae bacterium]|jgi:hypothetical protein|nr:hypothetical protein [Christensenellaceae bacterium]
MRIALAAVLTAAIEVPFLCLTVCRDKSFVAAAVLANLATNLILHLAVLLLAGLAGLGGILWMLIYPLEALVVFVEYGVYRLILAPSRRLLLLTLVANAISYGTGVLLFGYV